MRTVLLQLYIGSAKNCTAWSNIPVANGVQITIYTNISTNTAFSKCAEYCFLKIKRSLISSGGVENLAPCFKDYGMIFHPHTCAGAVAGLHKRILIYIADGSRFIDPDIEQYFSKDQAIIIPIVDQSLGSFPQNVIPNTYKTIIAERTHNFNIETLIPRILRRAGILGSTFRLFISYRHNDAKEVASQLFHVLTERKFDVFLDRFSSDTGDDFVPLIREELFDKACILVLETDEIGQSIYCRQEVATATAYNLGLMAIDLPGSKRIFHSAFRRLDLTRANLNAGRLQNSEIDKIINFIETYYDHEVARRFRAQDKLLVNSILAAGLRPKPQGIGQYRVNNGKNDYLLTMSRCPPEVDDFIQTEESANAPLPVAKAVLFGPFSILRTQRFARTSWLGKKSSVLTIDEAHIQRSINNIAKNKI